MTLYHTCRPIPESTLHHLSHKCQSGNADPHARREDRPQSRKAGHQSRTGSEHDFNHESVWAEGVEGDGIGEYIIYEFPGNCPRVTTVMILNGYVKNDTVWKENSRVRKLRVYYNDSPVGILELEDSRTLQWFDVGLLGYGPDANDSPEWTLKFEILEVYPGTRHKDTVISEIFFDGVDVH